MIFNSSVENWENELKISISCGHSEFGSCLLKCPHCDIYGFYSPRLADKRKYWACKWCGFWCEINSQPYFCNEFMCFKCPALVWSMSETKKCDICHEDTISVKGLKLSKEQREEYIKKGVITKEDIRKEVYEIHQYSL